MDIKNNKMSGIMYIVTHKEFEEPDIQGYTPLLVGANSKKIDKYLRDDEGENISSKNPNYCELTGLYWIWKNTCHDWTGLCHYRRFFTSCRFSRNPKKFITIDEIQDILKQYDMIVPKPKYFVGKTSKAFYGQWHYEKDLELTGKIILELCPEYYDDFQWCMRQRCGYVWNMMIARRKMLEEYCDWLFTILFEVEQRIDITGYDDMQARIFGFLSELLLNVWIKHNAVKIYEKPVVNLQESRLVFMRRIPLEILLNLFDENCRHYKDIIQR